MLKNKKLHQLQGHSLNDPYCPAGLGYVKYEYVKGTGKDEIVIHYVLNTFENPPKPMDIKFKNP